MGSCHPSDNMEMTDFNFSILRKEDIHQNPKVKERIQAHDQADYEYRTQPF